MELPISTYQDYLDFSDQQPLTTEESMCDVCGAQLEIKSDNVGFEDTPKIETWVECPNGHIQDEGVVIL